MVDKNVCSRRWLASYINCIRASIIHTSHASNDHLVFLVHSSDIWVPLTGFHQKAMRLPLPRSPPVHVIDVGPTLHTHPASCSSARWTSNLHFIFSIAHRSNLFNTFTVAAFVCSLLFFHRFENRTLQVIFILFFNALTPLNVTQT